MLRAASLLATQPWSPGQKFREGLKKNYYLSRIFHYRGGGGIVTPIHENNCFFFTNKVNKTKMFISTVVAERAVHQYLCEQTMPSSNVEAV